MDRLSELPDSVIFHIFWLLPMNEVVRTTILSKRWLNLWTTTPFLNFDESKSDSQFSTTDKFRHFVHQALLRWDGVKVLRFKVVADYDESGGDVDLWVRFAKKYEVEELYLHNLMPDMSWIQEDHHVSWVPQYLCSCSSLKMLSIENCYFRIKVNVQWNQLKSLRIMNGFGVTEDVINQILCGSPQLEVLTMSFEFRAQSLCIRSTSLKELSICKYIYDDYDDASTYTELRIWTPNLKTLKIKGNPYKKCLLMNVSSLTHATIGYSYVHVFNEYCDMLSTNHFIGDLVGQVLPSIQHVENITLLSCCVKVLGAMIEGCMNSSSPNVKSLRHRFHCSKYVGMIEISPLLKKLFIEVGECVPSYDYRDSLRTANTYLQLEKNLPMSFVLELRRVEVTLVEGDILFPFLEFLLKNASKLEKIVFRVKRTMSPSHPSNSLRLASKRLLRMPRSSLAARFTLSEY